jgi:hypothetical protein
MNTPAFPAFAGGDPFASEIERMLWEAGYPTHYDTVEEAEAVVAELQKLPEWSGFSFTVEA